MVCARPSSFGLNALSGIGGVQTESLVDFLGLDWMLVLMPCRALEAFRLSPSAMALPVAWLSLNALSGIGGVQTNDGKVRFGGREWKGLNALSGIGGVQTRYLRFVGWCLGRPVLMPCRALEAFRRVWGWGQGGQGGLRLNALSGIGGVQTYWGPEVRATVVRLNALSGIGGVQTC